MPVLHAADSITKQNTASENQCQFSNTRLCYQLLEHVSWASYCCLSSFIQSTHLHNAVGELETCIDRDKAEDPVHCMQCRPIE